MTQKRSGRARSSMIAGIGFCVTALAAGTADAAWFGTNSKAYTLDGATQIGALPETQTVHVVLGLKLQNESALDQYLARTHTLYDRDYGSFLSRDEAVSKYAPTQRQVDTVTAYLSRAGFTNIEVAPNRLLVTADGRPSKIEAAFNTRLRQFNLGGRSVFANTVDALIPDALNGIVHSVLGLQNADQAQPLFVRANAVTNASSGTTVGHSPAEFPAIYDALSIPTGGGVNVGIVTTGDLTAPVADLQAFESQNGIAPVPLQFVPSEVNGSDPSAAVEWILDSQSIVGISGGVRTLYFYNAPSRSDADLTADYNRAVSDDLVKAVNVSLGICEQSPHSSGTMATDDGIFKMAMAEGMTFFVSTGDGGANTGCSSQKGLTKAVGYPASSPYVVAVGGTTLSTTNGTTYAGETAWSGSGGGTSKFETAQSWQQAVTGSTAREVPDVAMDADPNSGAILIVGSSTEQVGGTSLAAPLSVGTWARVQTAHGGSLGFAAPVIYAAAAKSPSPFHDVTSGGNGASLLGIQLGGYKAGVGYDEVTGFGSFDIARFSAVAQ